MVRLLLFISGADDDLLDMVMSVLSRSFIFDEESVWRAAPIWMFCLILVSKLFSVSNVFLPIHILIFLGAEANIFR